MINLTRPAPGEYAPSYESYLQHVPPTDDVFDLLERQGRLVDHLVAGLSEDRAAFRYAPDKWSVKQVLGHLADSERVFAFRAVWFARGEESALPGMDENLWGRTAGADGRSVAGIGRELTALRELTLEVFASLPAEAWSRRGVANDNVLIVRAVPWIIAGHERHHLEVLRDRYGIHWN
ncbi:MAG TPA: DinB family protein [Candidatus Krumholzibacteria bacterium]|nr:DinB family protein [Candidatus Krumholzibacteria bacterium]HPD72094.1 DinB family protein [Candidatus Krumholzibacteria bacterium]HRY40974.1 DinB family protein [Candidatus Krumholzibacteria bacterium]